MVIFRKEPKILEASEEEEWRQDPGIFAEKLTKGVTCFKTERNDSAKFQKAVLRFKKKKLKQCKVVEYTYFVPVQKSDGTISDCVYKKTREEDKKLITEFYKQFECSKPTVEQANNFFKQDAVEPDQITVADVQKYFDQVLLKIGAYSYEVDAPKAFSSKFKNSPLRFHNITSDGKRVPKIKGMTEVQTIGGFWLSTTSVHQEDLGLPSCLYLYPGSDCKVWLWVEPEWANEIRHAFQKETGEECEASISSKKYLLTPKFFEKHNIPLNVTVQKPGTVVLTKPDAFHMVLNWGCTLASTTNFWSDAAVDEVRQTRLKRCQRLESCYLQHHECPYEWSLDDKRDALAKFKGIQGEPSHRNTADEPEDIVDPCAVETIDGFDFTPLDALPDEATVIKISKKGVKRKIVSCHLCQHQMTSDQLSRHIARVHSDRPLKCTICGRSWTLQYQLDRHIATHFYVRPAKSFFCPTCNKGFRRRSDLAYHQSTKHQTTTSSTQTSSILPVEVNIEKPVQYFFCHICNRGFTTRFALAQHNSSKHQPINNSTPALSYQLPEVTVCVENIVLGELWPFALFEQVVKRFPYMLNGTILEKQDGYDFTGTCPIDCWITALCLMMVYYTPFDKFLCKYHPLLVKMFVLFWNEQFNLARVAFLEFCGYIYKPSDRQVSFGGHSKYYGRHLNRLCGRFVAETKCTKNKDHDSQQEINTFDYTNWASLRDTDRVIDVAKPCDDCKVTWKVKPGFTDTFICFLMPDIYTYERLPDEMDFTSPPKLKRVAPKTDVFHYAPYRTSQDCDDVFPSEIKFADRTYHLFAVFDRVHQPPKARAKKKKKKKKEKIEPQYHFQMGFELDSKWHQYTGLSDEGYFDNKIERSVFSACIYTLHKL